MIPSLFGIVEADSADPVSGHAWSPNTGWVSFNCTNDSCGSSDFGVSVGSGAFTRLLSGHAWSSNLGWISFESSDLTGCPSGTCSARMNTGTGELSGWAKALSAEGAEAGGWGGWIKLRGATYGVLANGVKWTGYAWGGGAVTGTGEMSPYIGGTAETGWVSFRGYTTDDVPQVYGVNAATTTNAEGPRSISCGVNTQLAPLNSNVTWSVFVDATKVPGPYTYEWYLPGGNTFTGAVTSSVTAPYYIAGYKRAGVTVTANGIPYVVDCDAAPVSGSPATWYSYVIIGGVDLDAWDPTVTAGPYQAGMGQSISFEGDIHCYGEGVGVNEVCDFPVTEPFNNAFIVDMGSSPSRNGADYVLPAAPIITYIEDRDGASDMEVNVTHNNWAIVDSVCPYTNPTPTCQANFILCADQTLSPYSATGVICEASETNCGGGSYGDNNCNSGGWQSFQIAKAPPPPPEQGICKATPSITKPGREVTWSVVPGSVVYGLPPFTYEWEAVPPQSGTVPPEDVITDVDINDTQATKTYSTYGIKRVKVTVTDSLDRTLERECVSARMTIYEET